MRPETRVGYDYIHAIADDHSRVAFVERHDDETAATVTGFVERALVSFAEHDIAARRLMTDNAFAYIKNRSLRELLARNGIPHLTTQLLPPAHQRQGLGLPPDHGTRMGLRARPQSHRERNHALPHWLDHYNQHRPHSSLGGQPPISS
jgi:transposase InsO family protein